MESETVVFTTKNQGFAFLRWLNQEQIPGAEIEIFTDPYAGTLVTVSAQKEDLRELAKAFTAGYLAHEQHVYESKRGTDHRFQFGPVPELDHGTADQTAQGFT